MARSTGATLPGKHSHPSPNLPGDVENYAIGWISFSVKPDLATPWCNISSCGRVVVRLKGKTWMVEERKINEMANEHEPKAGYRIYVTAAGSKSVVTVTRQQADASPCSCLSVPCPSVMSTLRNRGRRRFMSGFKYRILRPLCASQRKWILIEPTLLALVTPRVLFVLILIVSHVNYNSELTSSGCASINRDKVRIHQFQQVFTNEKPLTLRLSPQELMNQATKKYTKT